jgi:hypothetical protein
MRRFLLTVATAATALVGTACSDSTGIGGLIGSYELVRINGQSLPVQLGTEIVEDGTLRIDSDGTFTETIEFCEVGTGFCDDFTFSGTWDDDGSDIVLDYDQSNVEYFAERRSGGRLVYEDEFGDQWEYRRF